MPEKEALKNWKIGVIGCGLMGSGIVQVCAQAGYDVLAAETNPELLKKGLDAIYSSLEKAVQKVKLTGQDKETTLARIKGTVNLEGFFGCNLVIEAIAENLELKQQVFKKLDTVCPDSAILASNTSSLSIAEIAKATRRPEKVIGIHFFNPVPVMKLVEIVQTPATAADVLETAKALVNFIGKTAVSVQDSPGFIVNRLMTPQILNAIRLLEDGAASREDIDTAMTLGLNHPNGPIALADLIGLDTVLAIAGSIYQKTGDAQYVAPALLKQLVNEGKLGRKTGRGFYQYK